MIYFVVVLAKDHLAALTGQGQSSGAEYRRRHGETNGPLFSVYTNKTLT